MSTLSIIIPVYNVEEYLSKCLESILAQRLKDEEFEVILVNDGSTDLSLKIAESYQDKLFNLKIITQKNKGLSGARNTGLWEATNEYVFFFDSDDYLEPDALNSCIKFAKTKDVDILRFNYEAVNDNYKIIPKRKNSLHTIQFSQTPTGGTDFLAYQLGWACYAWQFIIKRKFLTNNNLFFRENMYFEDVEWLVRVLLKAQKTCSYNKHVYNYLQRTGSITKSINYEKQKKVYKDKLFLLDFLELNSMGFQPKQVKKWCKGLQGLLIISLFPFVKKHLPEKKCEFITHLKEKSYLPVIPFRYTLKQKRDTFLINLIPSLYYVLKKK